MIFFVTFRFPDSIFFKFANRTFHFLMLSALAGFIATA